MAVAMARVNGILSKFAQSLKPTTRFMRQSLATSGQPWSLHQQSIPTIMEQNNNAFLFKLFLRNSYLAVAGGMAIIPPIEKEIIKRGLMSDDELGEMAATAAAMPGMFAFNYCACLGRRLNGTAGSAVAVAGIALPALVVLLVLVLLFGNIAVGKGFESFLKGVRPAVVAMFAWPCIRLGRAAKINLSNLVIPLAAALAIWLMHISPFYIIVAVAVCGFVYGKFIQPN